MTTASAPVSRLLPKRQLGRNGPVVSLLGLGCMGMSEFYGARNDAQSLATLLYAIDRGVTLLDTADAYGPHHNEELVGRALAKRRDSVVLATKFGILRDPADPMRRGVDNRPEYVRAACDASLRRLGVDVIDLYYVHRHDPESCSIEETVGAMAELVRAGKIRHIGLSEVNATTLRRAHAVHPVTAVQSEYSLWSRDPELDGVLGACRELGVGFVPYSPLGRGFLSGRIKRAEDFPVDDLRRQMPRFQGENFQKNLDLVTTLERLAAQRDVTPAQLALAWVLAQGDEIVPIPGTTKIKHLDELLDATTLVLAPEEKTAIEAAFPIGAAVGERYYAGMRRYLGR